MDEEKEWSRRSFQPVYKDFKEVEVNKYSILIDYVDEESGKTMEGNIFLGGQIPYYDETGKSTVINSVSLKDMLVVGEQFGVEYLSKFPAVVSPDTVQCQGQSLPVECVYAILKAENDKNGENVFYVFRVYRKLK